MLLFDIIRVVVAGIALHTQYAHAANAALSELWTLVGCDHVELDSALADAVNLANAAIDTINKVSSATVEVGDDDDDDHLRWRTAYIYLASHTRKTRRE